MCGTREGKSRSCVCLFLGWGDRAFQIDYPALLRLWGLDWLGWCNRDCGKNSMPLRTGLLRLLIKWWVGSCLWQHLGASCM
jgi:hypothetical protein